MENLRDITGTVFNIQHYSIHDGPGIRTNVFVKGCPLRCLWCANPESQNSKPQLMYAAESCVGCGKCMDTCPQHSISLQGEKVKTDRKICVGCGKCVSICPVKARSIMGKTITAGDVFDEVAGDKLFYGQDGGITITGGEALAHPRFTSALLQLCKDNDISTAIETCGAVSWGTMAPIIELTDIVLFDLKHMDTVQHEFCTGHKNERILENLKNISAKTNAVIIVRTPIIPGYNDSEENMHHMGRFISEQIKRCSEVNLLAYHKMGGGKNDQLEVEPHHFKSEVPTQEHMENCRNILRGYGLTVK